MLRYFALKQLRQCCNRLAGALSQSLHAVWVYWASHLLLWLFLFQCRAYFLSFHEEAHFMITPPFILRRQDTKQDQSWSSVKFCSGCSQLPPCGHLALLRHPAITDSSKILGKSYRRLTEINFRYYGLSLLRTYGHFIRSQRHNFIVFSLVIADTEQHLGIFAHMSGLFFLLFETLFVKLTSDVFIVWNTVRTHLTYQLHSTSIYCKRSPSGNSQVNS